ncbi:MAG TPA: SgcJ/EcaC family oxidoreductase [Vicinamibacterales bacterium]
MSKRVRIVVCRVLGVGLLLGMAAQGAEAQSPDQEFQKIADAFMAAWANADAKAIAALHTKNGVRVTGGTDGASVGTAAIVQGFTTTLAGPYKGTKLVIKSNKFHQVDANTYVGEGTYQITGGAVPPGTPTSGQYMNTMVREGGAWKIAASAVMPAVK